MPIVGPETCSGPALPEQLPALDPALGETVLLLWICCWPRTAVPANSGRWPGFKERVQGFLSGVEGIPTAFFA